MLPRRLLSAGVDCRFSRGPPGPFSLLDSLTSNCRAARSPLTRARGRCTSSRNDPPTWPRANPTTEMCPRCPVYGETGETGLMMVPTRLGHREAGAARWLVCCLALAIFRAAREEDRGRPVEAGKRRDEGARARGREGTVVGAPGEEEGEGRSRWDRCENRRSAGRCSGRIPYSVLHQVGAPVDGQPWGKVGSPR